MGEVDRDRWNKLSDFERATELAKRAAQNPDMDPSYVFAPGYRAPLTDVNVNLYVGISALVFGGFLLWMAHRAS